MAAKAARKKGSAASEPIERLQASMRSLQKDAEKLLGETGKRAASAIGSDQKKAVERMLEQARKLGRDFEKRAEKAARDIEKRAEKVWAGIEKQTITRANRMLGKLDIASRSDIRKLALRVDGLEKKLRARRSK